MITEAESKRIMGFGAALCGIGCRGVPQKDILLKLKRYLGEITRTPSASERSAQRLAGRLLWEMWGPDGIAQPGTGKEGWEAEGWLREEMVREGLLKKEIGGDYVLTEGGEEALAAAGFEPEKWK